MKQFLLLLSAIVCFAAASAQTPTIPTLPTFYNYQGVARNLAGMPLANQTITVYSIIRATSNVPSGQQVFYSEKRSVLTNQFGLFSFQIGSPGADSASGDYFGRSTVVIMSGTQVPQIHTEIVLPGTTARISLPDTKLAIVPYAQYAKGARPWRYDNTEGSFPNATVWLDAPYWNLGVGTTLATEKLHVVGRLRLEDGTQGKGKVLTSDSNGVATWITPANNGGGSNQPVPDYFTLNQNNVGVGINYLSLTDTTRGLAIGTRSGIAGGAGLSVDGPLKFTGNGAVGSVNLIRDGDILTTDGTGNARWRSLEENPFGSPWVIGASGAANIPVTVIKPKQSITAPVLINNKLLVQLSNPLTGDGSDPINYPAQILGSQNGLAIRANQATPNTTNKYIGFFNDAGIMRGRIEGQTVADLQEDKQYIVYIALQTLSTGGFLAEGIACGFQFDFFEVAVQAAQALIWGFDLGNQIQSLEENAGIAYASGNADYAEWLERANHEEKFSFGDIVSVRGGKITKDLLDGGQLMVISKAPIVLGNMPKEGRAADYEKVAFMGQVPVKVQGVVAVGDYIVAKTDNLGVGYAVHPDKITMEEYSRIVGVAWEASTGKAIAMVNTAVGVNTHAANSIIKKQEAKIALLENQFNQLSAYLQSKDPSYQYTKLETRPVSHDNSTMEPTAAVETMPNQMNAKSSTFKSFGSMSAAEQVKYADDVTKAKLKKILAEKPQYLDAMIKVMKEKIEANNLNLETNPQLKRILNDRAFLIETIKKAYNF